MFGVVFISCTRSWFIVAPVVQAYSTFYFILFLFAIFILSAHTTRYDLFSISLHHNDTTSCCLRKTRALSIRSTLYDFEVLYLLERYTQLLSLAIYDCAVLARTALEYGVVHALRLVLVRLICICHVCNNPATDEPPLLCPLLLSFLSSNRNMVKDALRSIFFFLAGDVICSPPSPFALSLSLPLPVVSAVAFSLCWPAWYLYDIVFWPGVYRLHQPGDGNASRGSPR